MKPPSSGTYRRTHGPRLDEAAKPVVLLVDDCIDAAEMYALYLRRSGFDVVTACDGVEAVAVAKETRPHAIVTDLSLPSIDGIELTRMLQSDSATWNIPVVMVTASLLPGLRQRAREAGVSAFLSKPCLPATLATEVGRVLAFTMSRAPVVSVR
jgi:CheY-like chemotaxis protein